MLSVIVQKSISEQFAILDYPYTQKNAPYRIRTFRKGHSLQPRFIITDKMGTVKFF